MISFHCLWALLLLPLPFIMPFVLRPADLPETQALHIPFMARFTPLRALLTASPEHFNRKKQIMAYLLWLLLVMAAAQPVWVGKPVSLTQAGRNIMLAIDLSGSMGIPDMSLHHKTVDRLTMVKAVATPFIQERTGDRVGLILFGTQAYLQTPLTFDRKTVIQRLNRASLGLAGEMTNIGDAVGLAIKRLKQYPKNSRVLILLTDGASNTGTVSPVEAAEMAAKEGIQIYTIGIGSDRALIQTVFGPQYVNPAADLDEETLKKMADMTGGQYFRARNTAALQQIYARINRLEPIASGKQYMRPLKPLYMWPLGVALFFSILGTAYLCIQRQRVNLT